MLLPGIVPILHDSLLNEMTIITKVGGSYVDHINDDAPGSRQLFLWMLPGSLLPLVLRREPGDEASLVPRPRPAFRRY